MVPIVTFREEHLFPGTVDLHHMTGTDLTVTISCCPWMQPLLQRVQEYIEPAICIPVCAFVPPVGKLCYPSHHCCKSICSSKLRWSLSFSLNISPSTSTALIYQSYSVFFLKFSLGLLNLGFEMIKECLFMKSSLFRYFLPLWGKDSHFCHYNIEDSDNDCALVQKISWVTE